ncbi:MAG TPA: N-acetylmuramoyl-L-alanine amidase, partial [Lacipirellulaceae bacterium]|nr:N-acetylmuramoyl-L-alanine amidase [Lacipirellulaceae bacterium]
MSNWVFRAMLALSGGAAFRGGTHGPSRSSNGRRPFCFESLEPRLALTAVGLVTTPQTYSGALSGKVVFTSGGHGIGWTGSAFATERPDYWQSAGDTSDGELVEDFGNQDQMSLYADYILRAGGTVVPMRPVGHQTNEVVLDNDSPDVTFSGAWSNSTNTRFYDEDYGATTDAVPYEFANTVTGAPTATATYTPNIPAAGNYPVYTWVHWGTDRTQQTYTINHTGGSTQITVDHSIVGDGWVYLGTYHFDTGKSTTGEGSVVITNQTPTTGKVVIADAIRFGNGMGDFVESGAPGVSGSPREDEDSYDWIARSIGQGTTISAVIGGDTNVSAPSDFAEYMYHGSFGGALYISFHSNGGTGASTSPSRGALGLYDNSVASRTPNQVALAQLMATQVNGDMASLNGSFEYTWSTPATNTDSHINFGEIDLGANGEMDATIVEVAYHDNLQDNALLRDPKVRDQIARSVYQGTVQYFATYGSPVVSNTSAPSAPINVSAVSNASGSVTLNWLAGASSIAAGDAATGYRVYASVDGYGFDGGRVVAGGGTTTLAITGLATDQAYYLKIVAVNAGGESVASEVLTAMATGGTKQVLIVNGFDRLDRTQDFDYPYTQAGYATPDPDGFTNRVWPAYNNSRDYVIQYETAIQAADPGVHVSSTSNEAVISGAVNLNDYDTVIWILGDEST